MKRNHDENPPTQSSACEVDPNTDLALDVEPRNEPQSGPEQMTVVDADQHRATSSQEFARC